MTIILPEDKILLINNSSILLKRVDTFSQIRLLIDKLCQAIDEIYPFISCKTDCSECCRDKSLALPVVTPVEWNEIFQFLLNLDENIRNKCIEKNLQNYKQYNKIFQEIHNNIQGNLNKEKILRFSKIFFELDKKDLCPFLDESGNCIIYPVRPLKCQAYGNFLIIIENKLKFGACYYKILKLETFLISKKINKPLMPIWNPFETCLMNLSNKIAPHSVPTILPIWFYTHLNGKNLVNKINFYPEYF